MPPDHGSSIAFQMLNFSANKISSEEHELNHSSCCAPLATMMQHGQSELAPPWLRLEKLFKIGFSLLLF